MLYLEVFGYRECSIKPYIVFSKRNRHTILVGTCTTKILYEEDLKFVPQLLQISHLHFLLWNNGTPSFSYSPDFPRFYYVYMSHVGANSANSGFNSKCSDEMAFACGNCSNWFLSFIRRALITIPPELLRKVCLISRFPQIAAF